MKTCRLLLAALLLAVSTARTLAVSQAEPPDFANTAAAAATFSLDLGSNAFSGTVPAFSGDADFFKITVPVGRRVTSIAGTGSGLSFPPAPLSAGTYTISCAPGQIISDVNWSFTFTVAVIVANTNDSGPGSLRQAIASAAGHAGSDTISFEPALSGQTITLSSEIVITDAAGVTVDAFSLAAAPIISGGTATRLFRVDSGTTATLRRLNLTAGNGAGGGSPSSYGGAIHTSGNLTLTECTVSACTAFVGAGIYNVIGAGTLTLDRCTFSGGTAAYGGAIQNESSLTATNCTFTGNTAQYGGAISTAFTNATLLRHCTVSGNSASVNGGGLILGADLRNCIVAGNTAGTSGADIFKSTGTITAMGANLIGNNDTVATEFPAGPFVGTPGSAKSPLLAPLGGYGGPTQTMPPLLDSLAIDTAIAAFAPSSDQRGNLRISAAGPAPDLGAVELGQTTVNTTADETNGFFDGISLREALTDPAQFGSELIRFDPSVFTGSHTISLGSTIDITKLLCMVDAASLPNGLTIDDGTATNYGLLFINAGCKVTLRGLTFFNGGGANFFAFGGALRNRGILTMTQCTLFDNYAIWGGAIFNDQGALTMTQCFLTGNGADTSGGAIRNTSTLTMNQCVVSGNTDSAIVNDATMTLVQCTLSGNSGGYGGAISSSGTTTLAQCTLTGNTATTNGGAIYNLLGLTTLTHCTVSGNTAPAGAGSGVAGGGHFQGSAQTVVQQTIIAGNTNSDVDIVDNGISFFTSQGHNLIGTGNATGAFPPPNNFTNAVPFLAPLGNYGGPTQTMPPLSFSPAIDAAVGSTATTDQRGASRTAGHGSGPDIGAVELGQTLVNTVADENNGLGTGGKSLREALTDPAPFGSELILFSPAVFNATLPATNTLSLGSTITVTKPFSTVDSAGLSGGLTINDGAATTYRLFTVNASATVALRSLTLANGGGAGFNTFGGAFRNSGRLMLTQCTLTGNSANSGGAIRNDGTLTLTQCTLTGNTATVRGGAIENNLGLTTLTHCTVTGNTAPAGAGSGVTSIGSGNGETVVENTIIAGNTNSDVDYVLGANNTFTPRGANIIGTGNATGDFIAVGDLIGFNAASLKLAPLGNYGGTTQTMALQPGNYAANSAAMLRPAILSDQRGFPIVSQPDIGAYEAGTFTNYNAFIYEKLPSTATTPQHATTFDFDGDGATNTQEWAALTDPASAASVFRATATRSGGNLIITFPTVAGKTYTLWQSNTLGSWTNTGQIALSGNGSPRTFTVTAPVAGFPKRFYRVEVGP